MSGHRRIKSASDIYHVMLRGNRRQTIFLDDADYRKFFDLLYEKVLEKRMALYAWCLMPNHVHLLLKEKQESLGDVISSLLTGFVNWYNAKYRCKGHLFEGRFRSRPVEDETYFLRVFRYIHRNPLEAHLCERMEDYPYSSFAYYFRNGKFKSDDLILNLLTKDAFEKFHQEKDPGDGILDVSDSDKITDEEIEDIVIRSGTGKDISEVGALPRDLRTDILRSMLLAGGSYRQISRLTGISLSVIRAVSREMHHDEDEANEE